MSSYDTSENAYFRKSKTFASRQEEKEKTLASPEINIDLEKYSKTEVRKKVLVYARVKH